MAYVTTSWSTVHDALVTLVEGNAPTATRTFGWTPHPDEIVGAGTWAWVPDSDPAESATQKYAVSSLTAKEEGYELEVVILGITLTPSGKDARDRVDAVLFPILGAISNDPQAAGLVQLWEVVSVRRESAAPARTERHHSATVRVRVQAWLTHSGD